MQFNNQIMESILLKINAERITEFRTFDEWVNKASSRLGHLSDRHHVLICLDKEGNACHIGADFMKARDNNLFPVTAFLIQRSVNSKAIELPHVHGSEEATDLYSQSAELMSLRQSILESRLVNFFPKRPESFHDKVVFAISNLLEKADRADDLSSKLDKGRHYLMGVEPKDLTVEDALEAFGYHRNGLGGLG